MLLSKIAAFIAGAQIVIAHTTFTTFLVNGVNQGDGTCVRMPMTPSNCTYPISDLTSNAMACGYDGTVGVARVCSVPQASTMTFVFREYADGSKPGAIDSSHKGPCAVYMKSVSSAITDPGYGSGWFKIWELGYDNITSQWCTEKLIQNNGLLTVDIPADLAGGYYLVRPELLALHQADKTPPNPQFYTGCAQVFLQSVGTGHPSDTVSIPGYVSPTNPSVLFNIYTPKWLYPMPGPAVYESKTSKRDNKQRTNLVQTEGLMPKGCILVNANWCGVELDAYSTMDGCWNASKACYAQATTCYGTAPPTGSKNCPVWEAKCKGIQDACNAGNFNGPPSSGKKLTPVSALSYFSIPPEITLSAFSAVSVSTSVKTSSKSSSTTAQALTTSLKTLSKSSSATIRATTSVKTSPDCSSAAAQVSMRTTATSAPHDAVPSFTFSTRSRTFTFTTATKATIIASPSATVISRNATCGPEFKTTCFGSRFGFCCSQHGWCGNTAAYCGDGCQEGYGLCAGGNDRKRKVKRGHLHEHLHGHAHGHAHGR